MVQLWTPEEKENTMNALNKSIGVVTGEDARDLSRGDLYVIGFYERESHQLQCQNQTDKSRLSSMTAAQKLRV